MSLRIVSAIARKDIVDAVRNLYIIGAIVLPLFFWLIFRLMVASESELKISAVAIYDQGSSRLVEQLLRNPLVGRVVETRSFDELRDAVRKEAPAG